MNFDLTVSAGNLITFSLAIIGFISAWYKFGGRLEMLEYRVTSIDSTLKLIISSMEKLRANEKMIALTEARVNAFEAQMVILAKEIYDLRRSDGWVQNHRQGNVDEEYKRKD